MTHTLVSDCTTAPQPSKHSLGSDSKLTCADCARFDAYEGWCGLHKSAQWPDQPACRLAEQR